MGQNVICECNLGSKLASWPSFDCGRVLEILPHALALEVTFPYKLCSNGKKLHTLLHIVLLMAAYTPRAQNDKVYKGI